MSKKYQIRPLLNYGLLAAITAEPHSSRRRLKFPKSAQIQKTRLVSFQDMAKAYPIHEAF